MLFFVLGRSTFEELYFHLVVTYNLIELHKSSMLCPSSRSQDLKSYILMINEHTLNTTITYSCFTCRLIFPVNVNVIFKRIT